MSLDAIVSIGSVSSDPMAGYKARSSEVDLSQFDPSAKGAHLSTFVQFDAGETRSGLDVRNLYTSFQQGMQNGFTVGDNERLMRKVQEMQKPGSTVTVGEMMGHLALAESKASIASMLGRLSSKFAESIQTIAKSS